MTEQRRTEPGADKFANANVVDLGSAADSPAPAKGAAPGSARPPVISANDESFPQLVEQSKKVPILLDLWATWCEPCKQLTPVLEQLAADYGGRFLLAKIDIDASPQVARAFGVQSVPMVAALIGGQAVPLFTGAQPADRIRPVLDEVLRLAASQGVTGTVQVGGSESGPPPAPPIPPLHRRALDAIEAGDLASAAQAYREALSENPGDSEAKAALESVELLQRTEAIDADAVLAAAQEDPRSVDKALAAADAEMSLGAQEAAFDRLLAVLRLAHDEDRERLRVRLVEYFDIVGVNDPRVTVARRALASALF